MSFAPAAPRTAAYPAPTTWRSARALACSALSVLPFWMSFPPGMSFLEGRPHRSMRWRSELIARCPPPCAFLSSFLFLLLPLRFFTRDRSRRSQPWLPDSARSPGASLLSAALRHRDLRFPPRVPRALPRLTRRATAASPELPRLIRGLAPRLALSLRPPLLPGSPRRLSHRALRELLRSPAQGR